MNIKIQDLKKGTIRGVCVQEPDAVKPHCENYFEWNESTLTADFQSIEISGGLLYSWHHTPNFSQIEYHDDCEMFYFISGAAIMLFIDIEHGEPVMSSAQIVRIKAGTQIIIDKMKGHFVPVSETDEPVKIVVVSPKMPAHRIILPEEIVTC